MTVCPATGKEVLAKGDARERASQMRRTHRVRMDAYRCPVCSGWHVGHGGRRAAKRRTAR